MIEVTHICLESIRVGSSGTKINILNKQVILLIQPKQEMNSKI